MDENASDLDLRQYLRIIRRRKWIVIVTVLAALGTAILISSVSDKVYAGSSEVRVSDPNSSSLFTNSGVVALLQSRDLPTEVEVLRSKPVRDDVLDGLGDRAKFVGATSISVVGTTQVVRIRVESTVPSVARDGANTYAKVFIARRARETLDSVLAASSELKQKSDEKQAEITALDADIARAQATKPADVESLRAQRDRLLNQYSTYRDKYDQLQVDSSLQRGGATLVEGASLPRVPVRPTPVRNAILAVALGLFVGIGLAFLFEYLDDTVKTPDDLERQLPNLAFLGAVPFVADWRNRDRARAVTLEAPHSPVSEAYRALRTSVQFVALRQPLQTLLLTSPMTAEGKTTTVANLAVILARSGRNVTVVDCDLRRPRLHDFFDLPNEVGFTSVLLGDAPLEGAVQTVAVGGGGALRVLASGPLPPNPSELLGTGRVTELLTALQATSDIVLIDSPPLIPVTDALVLSRRVDGVLLVATAGVTSRRNLARCVGLLEQAEAPAIGLALNGITEQSGYGYAYYSSNGDSRSHRRRRREAARSK